MTPVTRTDPLDGDSIPGAIQQLIEHPLVKEMTPSSAGAVEATALQGKREHGASKRPAVRHRRLLRHRAGNLRADYVLPRKTLQLVDAGVFWPLQADPLFRLTACSASRTGGSSAGSRPPTSQPWIDVTVPSVR